MERKLFAFDVDGTLLDHKNNEIPKSAVKAIKELRENGHVVGVATGRNQRQFQKALDAKDFDFVIYCNGGYLEIAGEKVSDIQFTQAQKNELCDLFDSLGYEYGITTHHHLYAKNPMAEGVQKIVNDYRVLTPEKKQDLRTLPVYQFSVYEHKSTRDSIRQLEDNYIFHPLGDVGYDIVNPHIDKSIMLKRVADLFEVKMEDTIAFGDNDNDQLLLKEAGIGVAMGNGSEAAKKNADYVTTESYNDGIYKGIKKLGYIN